MTRVAALAPLLAAAMVAAGCHRSAAISSCDDDLRGVYVSGSERWMLLDNGPTLEAYPLLPDGAVTEDLVAAPRLIDLSRATAAQPTGAQPTGAQPTGAQPTAAQPNAAQSPGVESTAGDAPIAGTLRQRFMRREAQCDAELAVHVTRCAGDTLELVLADPSPPLAFAPCRWPSPGASRAVRWRRE